MTNPPARRGAFSNVWSAPDEHGRIHYIGKQPAKPSGQLPTLRTDRVTAHDGGDHIELYAADSYDFGEADPVRLDATEATQLRGWLTTWLDRQ